MRSLLVVLCCLAVALWTPVSVEAKTCDSICETTDLWGISGQASGFKACQCSDSTTGAERTGPDCGCGGCYLRSGNRIIGQARLSDGSCPTGATACDDCDIASSSSGSKNSTVTTTTAPPSTSSPTTSGSTTSLTPSSTSSASGTSGDSTSATGGKLGSSSNSSNSGSTSSSSSSSGLATWQIALIICSAVLVIAVVMITITSCYCKARNRMKDNELIEQDTREYERYWHPGGDDEDHDNGNYLANSGVGGTLMQGGRGSFNSTHSRPNSAKNVQYEPTYSVDERIGAARSHRGSLGSNADLPGVYQPFPQRERPSHGSLGSSADLPGIYQPFPQRERPSQEVGSRKNISIEL